MLSFAGTVLKDNAKALGESFENARDTILQDNATAREESFKDSKNTKGLPFVKKLKNLFH